MKKYYDILGLSEGASKEEIQEAYDRLSKELDPQKNGNHEFFLEEYAQLEDAFAILTNKKSPPIIIPKNNPSSNHNSSKNNSPGSIINFKNVLIFFIIIFILVISKSKSNSDDSNPYDNSAMETPAIDTSLVAVDTSAVFADTNVTISNDIEYYETPENGFSPYNDYFGQGVYEEGTNNEFVIKNSNETDAVVCLVDYYSGTKIRNEFIRKGSSFKMSNISNGTYYLAWFSGNNWSPNLVMNDNFVGGFQSDANFSKSDNPKDLMKCEGDMRWTITLYSVENGNMSQKGITENEFFN